MSLFSAAVREAGVFFGTRIGGAMKKTVNTRRHLGMFDELTDKRLEYGFYYWLFQFEWGYYFIPN